MNNRWEFPNIFIQRHPIFYGEVANLLLTCYRLVVYVADLLATQRGSLRQVSNLLRGSYGETGVMDFGLFIYASCPSVPYGLVNRKQRNAEKSKLVQTFSTARVRDCRFLVRKVKGHRT